MADISSEIERLKNAEYGEVAFRPAAPESQFTVKTPPKSTWHHPLTSLASVDTPSGARTSVYCVPELLVPVVAFRWSYPLRIYIPSTPHPS